MVCMLISRKVSTKTIAAILDELLTRWKDMGYRFAPIEELFA